MSLSYRARPGRGFILFVAVALSSAVFIGWGLRTPPLDQVWQMQLELVLGERESLAPAEFELLQNTLERYPDLADNMLDGAASGLVSTHVAGTVDMGYAYMVRRTRETAQTLMVSSPTGKRLEFEVRTVETHGRGATSGDESFSWRLPDEGPFPQLVEVLLLPASGEGRTRPMLVELREAP